MTKVLTFAGTRPELIRLSRVIDRLAATLDHKLVHTGQNWDPRLRDVFFAELGLPEPDHQFAVDSSTLGRALAGILVNAEKAIAAERPDAVLVLGDTTAASRRSWPAGCKSRSTTWRPATDAST
jgi:UDP-N-acetylglucosamine 2-epimerase (non-hydrolysing)